MMKFKKAVWRTACFVLALVYLFSCVSQLVPAETFSYTVFFALLFPYLFAAVAVAAIVNLFVNKKWALIFLFLIVPGLYNFFHVVAISPTGGWHMQKAAGDTRIMTWNVSDFINPAPLDSPLGSTRKKILTAISEYNPDILCLQEYFSVDSCRDLGSAHHELDSLGYHYRAFSADEIAHEFYGITERGVVILSKTPFLNTGRVQVRNDYHPEWLVWGDVMVQGKPARITTAHLASFYLFPDSARGYAGKRNVAKKLYTYKHQVEEKLRDIEILHDEQTQMINGLLDTASHPVVYCGDINATPTMHSYRVLKGKRQDAFLQKGNGIGATFYNIVPTLRIDMIFPSQQFTVSQVTVAQRNLGDHNPVIADLKWQ